MPNWTTNILKIYGDKNSLNEITKDILNKGEDGYEYVDFNILVPIPQEILESDALSIPETILNVEWEDYIQDCIIQGKIPSWRKQQVETAKYLIQKYGYPDWYKWSVEKWGTKWNATHTEIIQTEGEIEITFQTAWSQPEGWLNELTKKYPNYPMTHEAQYEGGFGGEYRMWINKMKKWFVIPLIETYVDEDGNELTYKEFENEEEGEDGYYNSKGELVDDYYTNYVPEQTNIELYLE